jgi:thiamine transport system substrate-binding protein
MQSHSRLHRFTILSCLSVLTIALSFFSFAQDNAKKLVVYSYDSFVSEWGPGPLIAPAFEKKYGIKLELVSCGDTGQLLAKAISEKSSPRADIILGLDSFTYKRARQEGLLAPYKSPALSAIPKDLHFDEDGYLSPYDYGYFAIVWDSQKLANPPTSLEALTRPEYAKKLILMDPRTSAPGLGFLYWTRAVYGDKYLDYWKRLAPSILTVTAGWDAGYGLFTSGEAPLVLSYMTDSAYHIANEKSDRYRALVFTDGHCMQVEGLGLVAGSRNGGAAAKFIDFMLSPEAQVLLPETNWMFPSLPSVKLPESYKSVPIPAKTLNLSDSELSAIDIKAWATTLSGTK